jgi:hypothetical protein
MKTAIFCLIGFFFCESAFALGGIYNPNAVLEILKPSETRCAQPEPDGHPFICSQPKKGICERYLKLQSKAKTRATRTLAAPESLERLSKALMGDAPSKQDLQLYANLLTAAQKEALDDFKKSGATESDLKEEFSHIQDGLIQQLLHSPEFSVLNASSADSKSNLINRLRALKWITVDRYSNPRPEDARELVALYQQCGIDGLAPGAFYDTGLNAMIICPGFLKAQSRSGLARAIEFTVAHELSHSFDALRTGANDELVLSDVYKKFGDCIRENDALRVRSISDTIQTMKKRGSSELEAYLSELKSAKKKDYDQIFKVKATLGRFDMRFSQLEERASYYQKVIPGGDAVDTHLGEMSADLHATELISHDLESVDPDKRLDLVAWMLGPLTCDERDNEIVAHAIGSVDEGIHPNPTYRAEMFMRNPKIRAELGCAPLKESDPPFCGMSGAIRK